MKKILFLLLAAFTLTACGNKTAQNKITPTPAPKLVDMPLSERPYISLIPRADGHMIYLKIDGIPSYIKQIEYELLYTAVDSGNEIEKGVGDTIKDIKGSIERSLLLGTESCTNGCKYKYDEGIIGGTIALTFISQDGQISTYDAPFTLKTGAEIKKAGSISLSIVNFSVKASPSDKLYYILVKNYAKKAYSIFSSGLSTAKYISIDPSTVTKSDQLLTGDYLEP